MKLVRAPHLATMATMAFVACALTHDVDELSRDYVAPLASGGRGAGGEAPASAGGNAVVAASAETVASSTTGACVEPVVPCGGDGQPCCQCSPPCPNLWSHCGTNGVCEACGYTGGHPCCTDETLDEYICEGIKRCVNGACLLCCAKCTSDANIYGPLDTGGDNNCAPSSGVVQTKCKEVKNCGSNGAQCCPSQCVANSGWCTACNGAACPL